MNFDVFTFLSLTTFQNLKVVYRVSLGVLFTKIRGFIARWQIYLVLSRNEHADITNLE